MEVERRYGISNGIVLPRCIRCSKDKIIMSCGIRRDTEGYVAKKYHHV